MLSRRTRALLLCFPLLPVGAGLQSDEPRLAARLKEVERRLDEERRSWIEFREQAATPEERAELAGAFPRDEFVAELVAIADGARGSELAARAWMDVFRIGCLLDDRALFERSLERLLGEHMASPEIGGLSLELVYGAPPWSARPAADALRRILAATEDRAVKTNCLAELALLVGLDDSFGAAGRDEAEALLARIEREYGSADFIGMDGKQFAAGARHEIERLRVGQLAPDFERSDQHGVPFALSGYRGRVVLLDFWGFV